MNVFLNTKEICEKLKISESTLYRLLTKGLPCLKIGGQNRFVLEDVIEWIKNNQKN